MNNRREDIIKELLFPEPLYSKYLESLSQNILCPYKTWVKVNSDEYVKYLRTETVSVTKSFNEALRNIHELRDNTLLTFIKKSRYRYFDCMEFIDDNSTLKVHRLIVAAFIPKLREISEKERCVKLSGAPRGAIEHLVNYMYTGEAKPSRDNFKDVLELSIRLQMIEFAEKWIEVYELSKPLRALQLLFRCRLSRIYKWKEYFIRLNRCLALEFENLILTEEFLRLLDYELLDILKQDDIGTQNEIVVFLAAIKWLNHDWDSRKKIAIRVMKEIRFQEMSEDELLACCKPPILSELFLIKEVKSMVKNAYHNFTQDTEKRRIYHKSGAPKLKLWITDNELNDLRAEFSGKETLKRSLMKEQKFFDKQESDSKQPLNLLHKNGFLSAISGDTGKLTEHRIEQPMEEKKNKFVTVIDLNKTDKTTTVDTKIEEPTEEQAVDVIESHGEDKKDSETSSSAVIPFSPTSSSLTSYSPTPEYLVKDTHDISISVPKNYLHVDKPATLLLFGDYYDSKGTAFIYRCDDMSQFHWKKYKPLPTKRIIPLDAVIVSDLKNVYCIGGILKTSKSGLSACDKFYKYELNDNTLTKIAPMKNKRIMHSVVLIKNRVFVIGGRYSKTSICKTIDVFNTKEKQWSEVTEMRVPRFGCACAAIKKRIFIFGGITLSSTDDKYQLLRDVVVFNPFTNDWSRMREPLPEPVAFASVVCCDEDIYIIGGRVKKENSPHLEMSDKVYCFNGMKWKKLPPLKKPRCHMVCLLHNKRIIAMGGSTNKDNRVKNCEVFHTQKPDKGWKTAPDLPCRTAGNMIIKVAAF